MFQLVGGASKTPRLFMAWTPRLRGSGRPALEARLAMPSQRPSLSPACLSHVPDAYRLLYGQPDSNKAVPLPSSPISVTAPGTFVKDHPPTTRLVE